MQVARAKRFRSSSTLSSWLRSNSRAFSIAIARGKHLDHALIVVRETALTLLVGEVGGADDAALRDDRHAEKRAHQTIWRPRQLPPGGSPQCAAGAKGIREIASLTPNP